MQYQRNKFEEKKKKHRKSRSPDNIDSDQGEMNYADPNGNQYIQSNAQVEQNIDINEQQPIPVRSSLQGTIVQIKNELKNRMELAQIMKENPIESLEVNIPKLESKSKSPKTINIGDTKEDIEYNIRTLNNRRSPVNIRNRQHMPSSDNLSGTLEEKYKSKDYLIIATKDKFLSILKALFLEAQMPQKDLRNLSTCRMTDPKRIFAVHQIK